MEYNLPYHQLEKLGLTAESVANLPEKFREQLSHGCPTDIIVAQVTGANGVTVEAPMRLQIKPDESGRMQLIVFPVIRDFENTMNLSKDQFEALKSGMVLHMEEHYIQRDPQTNCLLKVSDRDMNIEQKYSEIEKFKDIELGMEQKNQLKSGKPVLFDVGGEEVVVSLDLKNPNFYKTLKGDLNEWEYNKKVEYDIMHPEYLGVVKTDENRWEYQMIQEHNRFPEELRDRPKQTRNSAMSMH